MSGQSIGTIVGGIIGAVIGFFAGGNVYGGAMLGMTLGGMAGGMLDPPKGPHIEGPRIEDTKQQTSTYGAPIPRLYGTIAVFGNIFWIENNKLKEVAQTSTQGGKGGAPEGSSTTYKYYGTFALGLCKGPIVGVRRIWIGGKLWYNKGIIHENTMVVNATREKVFKLFLGTEDQMPAARMEADVGVANCPAYRGLAYILFHDLDLTSYGNSIATLQIKVEVVKQGQYAYGSSAKKDISASVGSRRSAFYKGYAYVAALNSNVVDIYDITDLSTIRKINSILLTQPRNLFIYNDLLYVVSRSPDAYRVYSLKDPKVPILNSTVAIQSAGNGIYVEGEYVYLLDDATSGKFNIYNSTVLISSITPGNINDKILVSGNYAYITTSTQANAIVVYDITDKSMPVLSANINISGSSVSAFAIISKYLWAACSDGKLRIYDISVPASIALINTIALPASPLQSIKFVGDNAYILTTSGFILLNCANLELPIVKHNTNVSVSFLQDMFVYNSHVFIVATNNFFSYLSSINLVPTTSVLGDIVSEETLQSKLLTAPDIDTSLLTQEVRGYRISNTAAIRGGLEPLQGAWPFDVIQDGYKIKFVPRGLSSVATISSDKLDARTGGETPGIKITKSREMDSILPVKVSIQHVDHLRGYDTGEQYAQRINTDAVNTMLMEMPIVLTASEAAQKCQTLLYLYWLERYDITFKLPPEYLHIQPTDVVTVTAPGEIYNVRLTQITYTTDGRLECQGKFNQPSIYTPTYSQQDGHDEDEELDNPGLSVFVPLDIPLLQDSQNTSGFTAAVTGSTETWQGATISRSDDGGQSFHPIQGVTPPGSIVGVATNTIAANIGALIDKSSILNVELYTGALSSVTELQMLNGQNHFAYGDDGRWEIIAAQNCVLQGDGTYKFTDLLRGRFGTEIYTGTHIVNDWVVYLDSAKLNFLLMNTNTINAARTYAAISSGDTIENSSVQNFTYKGVNLEPLNPVYLNGNRDVSGNWTLTWIRRTRIGGEWRDLVDATLGETTESYVIEIYSSNLFTVLRRTLTATTQTVSYTSANQVTDFGSNQATLNIRVYQVSDIVGTGYPLQASITR